MADLKDKNGEGLCWKDCETMREVLEEFGVTDTGPIEDKNMYIIKDNATIKKTNAVIKSLKVRLKANPKKNFLVIYVLAGHGMIAGGKQIMLLNEYSKNTGFYKLFGIEANIRDIAREFSNTYQVALFACGREVKTSKHGGGFRTSKEASTMNMRKKIVKGIFSKITDTRDKAVVEGIMAQELVK